MAQIVKPSIHLTQMDSGMLRVEYSVGKYRKVFEQVAPGPELAEIIASGMKAQEDYLAAAQVRRQCKLHDDVHYGVNTKEGYGHGLEMANRCFGPRQHKRRIPTVQGDPHVVASGLDLI